MSSSFSERVLVAVHEEALAAHVERRRGLVVLRELEVRARHEVRRLRQQVGAVAEVGPPVLALRDLPGVVALPAPVALAGVGHVRAARLPAEIEVPGQLRADLRIVGREVAPVAGRRLRPLREGERLTGRVVPELALRAERRLAGVLHRRLDVLGVNRVRLGRDDLHLELGKVLERVGRDLLGHETARLLRVRGRDDVAGLHVGEAAARARDQCEQQDLQGTRAHVHPLLQRLSGA